MRFNFMVLNFNNASKYAIAFFAVLLGCSAIFGKAQTDQASAAQVPAGKAPGGIVKGRVKLQDSKTA